MVVLIGLGLIDLIAAIVVLLYHFDIAPGRLALSFAVYLIGKGVAFPKDIASIVDFLAGLYILGMVALGFDNLLVYVVAGWLLQKAFLSMISH